MQVLKFVVGVAVFSFISLNITASAAAEFPFGLEMTLETQQLPGARHAPVIEIGENGEAKLDLWCKSGRGQFSVAADTVIFLPGEMSDTACTPALAQADDALIAGLGGVANWRRQGDFVSLIGPATFRFRLNSN
ncbi:MAG: META domain-containing protein [Xanthobacteraceae bacterium]|nr:META domain-containing protein [Xanthobacteraceae bacterium]